MPTYVTEKWVETPEGGTLKYRAAYGTKFEVDGEETKTLEYKYYGSYEDNKEYIKHWMRDKLRKLENGQIKVFKDSGRDWEQEEKIKKSLWEDIYVNETPSRETRTEYACPQGFVSRQEYKIEERRPPSPTCKIS